MSGELHEPEEIYDSAYRPNPASARDVLAFVLAPNDVLMISVPEDEREAAIAMLFAAKEEAIRQWSNLNKAR